jgi:hypothetical protein
MDEDLHCQELGLHEEVECKLHVHFNQSYAT